MALKDRVRNWLGFKESQARIVTTMNQVGRPVSTPANYEGFAAQGYGKNIIVYSAISKIATAAKGIDWCLYQKGTSKKSKNTQLEEHELLKLLEKPNPMQARAAFIESVVGFRMISGNSYVEANVGTSDKMGKPLELWPVRCDKMKIIPGLNGYPAFYEFKFGGTERRFPVDPVTLSSKIMHWKGFHPLNDWYGLSPLEAAMLALDQNNAGQKWNLALMQNSATPSGVLQMKVSESNPRGALTADQYARIKKEFEENYQGAKNAGKPLVIEGGLNWQAVSLSPKEMDFLKSREATAIDLCVALGVPPEIMGLGQKTFSNYAEARLAFYEETVLPTLDDLRDALNSWLAPAFGEGLYLDYDRDDIEALNTRRTTLMAGLKDVPFLTTNEKRRTCGFDDIEGGDELDKPAPSMFDGGNEADDEEENQDGKKPPKKPTKKPKDEEADEEETDDEANDGKGFASWKSINLLNRNEKVQSWKKQNARRKQLAGHFAKDLRAEWEDLSKKLESVARATNSHEKQVVEFALLKAASDWADHDLSKVLKRNIRNTMDDFGGMVLGEAKSLGIGTETKANLKFEHYVQSYVERHTATQIKTINSTNEKVIRSTISKWVNESYEDGLDNGELADRIGNKFKELSDGAAQRIARTEVAMASNNATLNAVKSLGAPNIYKEWVTASDARVRDGDKGGADHEAANGQEQALDDKFAIPPDASMDGPGDPSAGADQVINCRCVLTFRSKN